jgi:hypothetical protein
MARDDIFRVRSSAFPAIGEGVGEQAIINKQGIQIVTDYFDQMVLSGRGYHMQVGEESVPVNGTVAIEDTLVTMLADSAAGNVMIPMLYEVNFDLADTALFAESLLEVDKLIIRYSSGGATFVPANLRSDDPNAANGTFKVQSGAGIIAAAKSAVPNSVELARKSYFEDVITDPTTGKMAINPIVYSVKQRPICVIVDAGSILGHLGAGTADVAGFQVLQFIQFPKAELV